MNVMISRNSTSNFRSTKAHSGDDMKIVFWINSTGSQLARFWIGN